MQMHSSIPKPNSATGTFTGKRVLVMGGSGFIGGWLCRRLSAAGAEVYGTYRSLPLDGRKSGMAEPECSSRRVSLGQNANVRQIDLTDTDCLRELIAVVQPEIVFNAAAYGVDQGERDAEPYQHLNVDLPMRLCELLHAGIKLVHIGSGAEYGNPVDQVNENTVPQPVSMYGASKLAGTQAIVAASERGQVHGLIARLFTIYGAGEHRGRLLPTLLEAARTETAVRLTSGHQQRDFTYVEDAVEGLLRLAVSPTPPGTIVNLATGKLTSVREFAEIAADVIGLDRQLLLFGSLPDRQSEIKHPPVSTTRMSELIRWTPITGVREGICKAAGSGSYAIAAKVLN